MAQRPHWGLLGIDEDGVGSAAASALGQIGDQRAVAPLIEALKDPNSVAMRVQAALAFGYLGNLRAMKPLVEMLKAEWDGSSGTRRAAARALGEIGDTGAVDALRNSLRYAQDPFHIEKAYALAVIGDQRSVDTLMSTLRSGDSHKRRVAAQALGVTRDPRAIPSLIKTLADAEKNVRSAAAEALGYIGDPTREILDTNLEWRFSPRPGVIGREDSRVVKSLIGALEDSESSVRFSAARALGYVGDPDAVEALITNLGRTDSGTPAAAIALAEIGGLRAVEPLVAAISAPPRGNIRLRAVEALGDLKAKAATTPLINALTDDEYEVRGAAATALAKIGDSTAFSSLLESQGREQHFRTRKAMSQAMQTLHLESTRCSREGRATYDSP